MEALLIAQVITTNPANYVNDTIWMQQFGVVAATSTCVGTAIGKNQREVSEIAAYNYQTMIEPRMPGMFSYVNRLSDNHPGKRAFLNGYAYHLETSCPQFFDLPE